MTVTIIGLGLIGGSLALDLKARRFSDRIIGVDKNKEHREVAMERGLVDEIMPLHSGINQADIIVLAIPVDAIKHVLPTILDYCTHQVVTDMGSSKLEIINSVKNHPNRANYVPFHPMAGTEFSGPQAALTGLFAKKVGIICDMAEINPKALETATSMFMAMNMRLIFMNSEEHDLHAAYVSHISHLTSFALALTVLDKEKDSQSIFNMASGGFDSTVRLAASSSEMWVPVFSQNKENVVKVMDTYIKNMKLLKDSIASDDDKTVEQLIKKANKIQTTLNQ